MMKLRHLSVIVLALFVAACGNSNSQPESIVLVPSADTSADTGANTEPSGNAGSDTDTNADSSSGTDTNAGSDSDTNTSAGSETDTNEDTSADTNTNTDTGSDSGDGIQDDSESPSNQDDTTTPPDSADNSIVLPQFKAPSSHPAGCIGSLNDAGLRFCVNPDTRLFSATHADGAVWWSHTLPGDNSTNEIESVLTVDEKVLLIADRFPDKSELTPDQRANQYEFSVFEETGEFLYTHTLSVDLMLGSSDEPSPIILRGDPSEGIRARVATVHVEGTNPQLLFGWHRFRLTSGLSSIERRIHKWDMAGVSRFDIITGERLADRYYVEQEIDALSVDAKQPKFVRVLTTQAIEWLDTDSLSPIDEAAFHGLGRDELVEGSRPEHNQINASNYRALLDYILEYVNAVPADKLFDANDKLMLNEQQEIEQIEDEYTLYLHTCNPSGTQYTHDIMHVAIYTKYIDNCQSASASYSGSLYGDYVGRDGFGLRADLSMFDNSGRITTGALRESTGKSRIGGGRGISQFGTLLTHDGYKMNSNEVLSDYYNRIEFFYYEELGSSDVCEVVKDEQGNRQSLYCDKHIAKGEMQASFSVNASWSSYSTMKVVSDFQFGRYYYPTLYWFDSNGPLIDMPIPDAYLDAQTPQTEFIISDGELSIEAEDGSKLIAEYVSNKGESVTLAINLFDKSGTKMGSFANHTVALKCAERLGIENCVVPEEER